MKSVESSGVLLQEQHGRRSGHTSIEVEVLRRVLFEYVINTIINYAIGLYDA